MFATEMRGRVYAASHDTSPAAPGQPGAVANVTKFLAGIDLPARGDALAKHAQSNGAPDEVVDELKRIPNHEYRTMPEIMKAVGGLKH